MYSWLILAIVFALLEALAVARNMHKLEYLAKPAVMVCLFLWLRSSAGLQGKPFWFGVGILFSLAGDVFLMIPRASLFLPGLIAFLFAHLAYISGFGGEWANLSTWSWVLLLFIALNVGRLLQRIVGAMRARGEVRLVIPVVLYGAVISVMLYAALSTLSDPAWGTRAALYAGTGALLFCASDAILAWNKFVSPIRNGRSWNMAFYHLGQIALIAGVISQFGA
jgi:uncharacterized membrane protein YhhN